MHNVWVLGYGKDNYSPWTPADKRDYDMDHAISRNTFSLFPGSWTAVRLKADNPGLANFRKRPFPK